jgi:hypothetical protein
VFLAVGCGGGDDGKNPGSNNGGVNETFLICSSGEAWVTDDDIFLALGFRSGGRFEGIDLCDMDNSRGEIEGEGDIWFLTGNKLTIYLGGGSDNVEVATIERLSNNTLRLTVNDGYSAIFTKKSGITIVSSCGGDEELSPPLMKSRANANRLFGLGR